ncbi:MAG: ketopantoate reductase family protein [Firmicutes bacterium]|nr:ketopantoate reductase family protein [Bacillota bacterium]
MKLLVFGAGVIGSYLSHILCKNNDVTLLARGERKQELEQNGLVIRHHLQRRTTTDKPVITDNISGKYDAAFVVMPYDNIRIVTGQIAELDTQLVICVGNNPEAKKMQNEILSNSHNKKEVLFGFQATAGKRENGILICERAGIGGMDIGALHSLPSDNAKNILEEIFKETGYRLNYQYNMQAYLYCHLAAILPIAYLSYICDGNLRKSTSKQRAMIQKASAEGYNMLLSLGYPILPAGDDKYFRPGIKGSLMKFLYFVMAKTVMGDLVACEHCRNSVSEMELLDIGFQKLIDNSNNFSMPVWNELKNHMPAWKELHTKYNN